MKLSICLSAILFMSMQKEVHLCGIALSPQESVYRTGKSYPSQSICITVGIICRSHISDQERQRTHYFPHYHVVHYSVSSLHKGEPHTLVPCSKHGKNENQLYRGQSLIRRSFYKEKNI